MKRILTIFVFLLAATHISGQSEILKISDGIRNITGAYFHDFKGMKGKLKMENDSQRVYLSKVKLAGSVDSTNLIYQNKATKLYSFTARMQKDAITPDELNSFMLQIIFFFGKLKNVPSGMDWIQVYVPEKKRKVNDLVRELNLSVYNGRMNPEDKTGDALVIKIGGSKQYEAE